MSKEEKAKEEKPYLQDLFDHMKNEHGLTLLQSEMQDIIDICMQQTDYNPLSSQLTAYKEALRETSKELEKVLMDWFPYDDEKEIHRIGAIVDKSKTLLKE